MPEAVLELRNLVRGYAQPVLTGVDLAVPRGTVMGLLGRNGAGKSTLLKCGLGILVPESGSATVFGEPAVALDEAAKERIGYVPQALSVFTWMRVRELIAFIGGF
jgi:ABC-2 type transport system ATP-binding protein